MDSWAEREEELKKRAGDTFYLLSVMGLQMMQQHRWLRWRAALKNIEEVKEDSAETKAKLAEVKQFLLVDRAKSSSFAYTQLLQMEETISTLEADRTKLRDQLREAQVCSCV